MFRRLKGTVEHDMGISRHLESYLGPITMGWQPSGEPVGVQICLFRDQPIPGVLTYSTLGLSRHVLTLPGGRSVRQEFVMAARSRFEHHDLPNVLFHLAEAAVTEHRALLCGELVPLGHPIIPESPCRNLYVSLPVVFPEGFDTYQGTQPSTVFAWLFPITDAEVEVVHCRGWSQLEEELERCDPDLFDLTRSSPS